MFRYISVLSHLFSLLPFLFRLDRKMIPGLDRRNQVRRLWAADLSFLVLVSYIAELHPVVQVYLYSIPDYLKRQVGLLS